MPVMGKQITFTLDSLDVGQLLDGLDSRAESWERTADYLRRGGASDELFLIEECSEAEEAAAIAGHYRSIIETIRGQMKGQS